VIKPDICNSKICVICKRERKQLSICTCIANTRRQHQISSRSQSYPQAKLKSTFISNQKLLKSENAQHKYTKSIQEKHLTRKRKKNQETRNMKTTSSMLNLLKRTEFQVFKCTSNNLTEVEHFSNMFVLLLYEVFSKILKSEKRNNLPIS
jgi:hypothetical protein